MREIVESCHKRATEILTSKQDILHNMARVLIEKETIHTEEVELLMQGKSAEEVIAYMEAHEAQADKPQTAPVVETQSTPVDGDAPLAEGEETKKSDDAPKD